MAALRSPNGSVIQATGRLEDRLLAAGWTVTDQPASPGLQLITAADLGQLASSLAAAVAASQTDRADLRQILEPIATWRTAAQAALNALHPVASSGDYTALSGRPTLGTMAAQGKSTVDITGGTIA